MLCLCINILQKIDLKNIWRIKSYWQGQTSWDTLCNLFSHTNIYFLLYMCESFTFKIVKQLLDIFCLLLRSSTKLLKFFTRFLNHAFLLYKFLKFILYLNIVCWETFHYLNLRLGVSKSLASKSRNRLFLFLMKIN